MLSTIRLRVTKPKKIPRHFSFFTSTLRISQDYICICQPCGYYNNGICGECVGVEWVDAANRSKYCHFILMLFIYAWCIGYMYEMNHSEQFSKPEMLC